MHIRKLCLTCALALSLAGCATQPDRDGDSDFARARTAYLAEDFEHAFPLMQLAARSGNAHAQYSLGYMYFNGQGVLPDIDQGLKWIREAAAQGEPRALEALGRLASTGSKATTPPVAAEAQPVTPEATR